mmetsp:Transcript_36884/g.59123  ORF Transcript_36884/g.59123 Transcript_36884/m.59123 type:complete len:252 (-) Transcript_36884:129-884(-)
MLFRARVASCLSVNPRKCRTMRYSRLRLCALTDVPKKPGSSEPSVHGMPASKSLRRGWERSPLGIYVNMRLLSGQTSKHTPFSLSSAMSFSSVTAQMPCPILSAFAKRSDAHMFPVDRFSSSPLLRYSPAWWQMIGYPASLSISKTSLLSAALSSLPHAPKPTIEIASSSPRALIQANTVLASAGLFGWGRMNRRETLPLYSFSSSLHTFNIILYRLSSTSFPSSSRRKAGAAASIHTMFSLTASTYMVFM